MTTFAVTRHPGARDWLRNMGLQVDEWVEHLDLARVRAGDEVVGTLPVHIVARLNAAGVSYVHLSVKLPAGHRGRELSAMELDAFGAVLEGYRVERLDRDWRAQARSGAEVRQ